MSPIEAAILIAAFLCAAHYFWIVIRARMTPIARITKTASVFLLALYGIVTFSPVFIIVALVLSSLGDFALTHKTDSAFLTGLSFFALAHVFYFFEFMRFAPADIWVLIFDPSSLALLCLLVLAIALILPHAGALKIPVLGYMGIIAVMGIFGLALPDPFFWAIIGVVLFILSDFCLGLERFRPNLSTVQKQWLARLVWPLYWCGQVLILIGIA
ncbi:MAG: lysoplasmalogenase [Pseudomonadota bacterium]